MSHTNIVCMTVLVFFLVSSSSALAVKPKTFPTKDRQVGKQINEAGVLVEPTAVEKVAPKTK